MVGHSYIVYAPLVAGATTVFREGAPDYPHNAIFYEIIEKYGVNVIFTAPTAVRMLMRYGEEPAKQYNLRSLRFLTCAGEPLNPRGPALGLRAYLRQRRVGPHRGQLVADGDGGPLPRHHGHHGNPPRTGGQALARRVDGHRGPGGSAH